jgi:hypothetical protein
MTSNILHHLQELQVKWRQQDFNFNKSQQEEYSILLQARRERVLEFHKEGRVFRGSKAAFDKLALENQVVEEQLPEDS